MKVICAGFSRTGTKSMSEALRILGYQNVHDFFEHSAIDGKYWNKIFDCKGTIEDFREMYNDVDAVADIPANMFWEEILEAFPDAKVVLTIRDSEQEWFKSFSSFLKHIGDNIFLERHRTLGTIFYRIFAPSYHSYCINACTVGYGYFPSCTTNNEILLRNCYRRHNRNVINGCPSDRLLVFNVKQGWAPLCKFLDKEIPENTPFPRKNQTHDSFMLNFVNGTYKYDGGMRNRLRKEIMTRFAIVLCLIFLVVVSLYTLSGS